MHGVTFLKGRLNITHFTHLPSVMPTTPKSSEANPPIETWGLYISYYGHNTALCAKKQRSKIVGIVPNKGWADSKLHR